MSKLVLSEGHVTPDSPISVQPGHVREDHERQRKGTTMTTKPDEEAMRDLEDHE